jgi:hypothetical protein
MSRHTSWSLPTHQGVATHRLGTTVLKRYHCDGSTSVYVRLTALNTEI